MAALDKHAPLMTRTIVQKPRVPWFSQEIREAKRQRTKAVKRWRKSRLDSDLAVFKAKRPVLWTTYPSYGQGSEGVLQKLYKTKIAVIKRSCSAQVSAYLTAQYMIVSHLIWKLEHSLTTWGNTLFRRSIRSARSLTPSSRLIHFQKMTLRLLFLMRLCHHSLLL